MATGHVSGQDFATFFTYAAGILTCKELDEYVFTKNLPDTCALSVMHFGSSAFALHFWADHDPTRKFGSRRRLQETSFPIVNERKKKKCIAYICTRVYYGIPQFMPGLQLFRWFRYNRGFMTVENMPGRKRILCSTQQEMHHGFIQCHIVFPKCGTLQCTSSTLSSLENRSKK